MQIGKWHTGEWFDKLTTNGGCRRLRSSWACRRTRRQELL